MTIKGISKPVGVSGTVSAPIADPYGNERIGLNLATKIDRTEDNDRTTPQREARKLTETLANELLRADEVVGFLGEFRHDEAVADVELVQGQQRCVALMPGTIGEVAGQPGDTVGDNSLVE